MREHTSYLLLSKILFFIRSKSGVGHGIHSPFLYRLISLVLNNPCSFYSFKKLEQSLPSKLRGARLQEEIHFRRILFRITNDLQPNTVAFIGSDPGNLSQWISGACGSSTFKHLNRTENQLETNGANIIVLDLLEISHDGIEALGRMFESAGENCIFVIRNRHCSPRLFDWWNQLQHHSHVTASIDFFHTGLLFFRKDFAKKHYCIRLKN